LKPFRVETGRAPILALIAIVAALTLPMMLHAQTSVPPSAPANLVAKAAGCGQVDLSWNSSADNSGTGLKAYTITRTDPNGELYRTLIQTSIGAGRTSFSDTNFVRSSATLSYTVVAQDNAGNTSASSNVSTAITPACPFSSNDQILDYGYTEPLGKRLATYGARTATVYAKPSSISSGLETWLHVYDSDTGRVSRFLLHSYPGYNQVETDYVLSNASTLWTLSHFTNGGKMIVSQFALNGSPIPTSATLVSTKALGDSGSFGKSMMLLKSGALMVAWNEDYTPLPDGSVNVGFAYLSPTGAWTVKFPVNIPNPYGGNITWSRMAMAQHPADNSIWVFDKRDTFHDVIAMHITETAGSFAIDWIQSGYINQSQDGPNGNQTEFPFLSAVADPTRNAILLAYQTSQENMVFVDPLLNDMNSIFLKEATVTIAQIKADGSKSFIPYPNYIERDVQFGFSALADGTLWLTYQPINHQSLTWNQVYASNYYGGAWSTPILVGSNYTNYNQHDSWDPGLLVYRTDQPQVSFRTPDTMIHSFNITGGTPPPPLPLPTTAITSPSDGATLSGVVTVTASVGDSASVAEVDLLIDGAVQGVVQTAPYTFLWDTTKTSNGKHTLQTLAYDAAHNMGSSTPVSGNVLNPAPAITITSPANGSQVTRNSTMTIAATATDTVAITKVEFYVAGKRITTDTTAPYTAGWRVPNKSGASYTIQAIVYDAAGKTASATTTVTAK
jgi:hypothetical protein